jgi:hypothetical protein
MPRVPVPWQVANPGAQAGMPARASARSAGRRRPHEAARSQRSGRCSETPTQGLITSVGRSPVRATPTHLSRGRCV